MLKIILNQSKKSKAQITLTIILGILILISIIILIYIQREIIAQKLGIETQETISALKEIEPIESSVQSCLESSSIDAVRLIGLQGGYLTPEPYIEITPFRVPYYIYENKEKIPSIQQIEKEISEYIALTIPICFESNPFPSFKIFSTEPKIKTNIENKLIKIEINYPIKVAKNDIEYRVKEEYINIIPINFLEVYDFSKQIVNQRNKDIDLTLLMNSNFDIAILPLNDNEIVYSITDYKSKIENIPYTFMFAVK